MIGIDITKISRFKNKEESFFKKILHKREIETYLKEIDKSRFLATRWVIKEALFKTNNSLYNFSKIEIIKENGAYKFENYIISTSNENDILIAIVQKEKHECKN